MSIVQFNDLKNYTWGLVIGQALVIGQLDVFLSYFALKL